MVHPRTVILLLALAALAAKLYCALTTIGSTDSFFFWKFAQNIHDHGIISTYRTEDAFNHTPLVGWLAERALALSGGNSRWFCTLLRMPAILADFLAVLALLRLRRLTGKPAWWALGLFAVSPVAFMISGYHGNVDSCVTLGLLLAAVAAVEKRPVWCGAFLGLACNFKIIPLLIAPVFFLAWWPQRKALTFTLAAALVTLAGWSWPLLQIPGLFISKVLGYGSVWGVWGIPYFLRLTGVEGWTELGFNGYASRTAATMAALKLIVIAGVCLTAWRRRGENGTGIFGTLALAWAIFFTFAPGFGTQYLIWCAPFFLVAHERWYAVITAACTVSAFAFYDIISGGLPWFKGIAVHSIVDQWVNWLVPAWISFTAYFTWALREELKAERALRSDSAAAAPVGEPEGAQRVA